MMKMNKNMLVVPFLALGAFWAFLGCTTTAEHTNIGARNRIDCEAFCEGAEMTLIEIRWRVQASNGECICVEVDPE